MKFETSHKINRHKDTETYMYINTINTIDEHHQTQSCTELGYWTRAMLTRIRVSQSNSFISAFASCFLTQELYSDTDTGIGLRFGSRNQIWKIKGGTRLRVTLMMCQHTRNAFCTFGRTRCKARIKWKIKK